MIIKDLVYGKEFGDLEIDSNHIILLGEKCNELVIENKPFIHKTFPRYDSYGYIYIIICLYNDPTLGDKNPYYKKYIGKCSRGYSLKKYYGSGKYIKRDMQLYGKENFVKIVFDYPITKEDAGELERYYIWLLNAQYRKDWYNLMPGGNGWVGNFIQFYENVDKSIHTQRMSNASLRMWNTNGFRSKMSSIHKKVQNLQKNREHQRTIQKYIQNLPEVKEKNRQSQLRRYSDPEERRRATEIQKQNWERDPNRRKFHSKRITEVQRGWKFIIYEHHKYYYKLSNHIEWKFMYDNEYVPIISLLVLKKHHLQILDNGQLIKL